jgi:thioredoxin-like negative regulator of GroEL
MERLIVLVVLSLLAVAVAARLQRRRPEPPTAPSYRAPTQVDRADFERPDVPILFLAFTSRNCNTCPLAWESLTALAGPARHAQRIDVEDDPDVHKRYRIDGVPTSLVIDQTGVVMKAFFGPVDRDEIRAALEGENGANDDH